MDFTEPFKYPLKDLKKLLIGGLMIFPGMFLLLIPLFMVNGYIVRVAESTTKGENELPPFSNLTNLFIKGLGVFLIGIVYGVITLIILLPAIICFIFAFSPTILHGSQYSYYNPYSDFSSLNILSSPMDMSLVILGLIFLVIALIPAIILQIMSYIAIVKYGEEGNIGAAFKFKKIYRNFRENIKNYIIALVLIFIVSLFIQIVYFVLSLTIIGIIFIGILLFYTLLFEIRMFAQIYKETKERGEISQSKENTLEGGLGNTK